MRGNVRWRMLVAVILVAVVLGRGNASGGSIVSYIVSSSKVRSGCIR